MEIGLLTPSPLADVGWSKALEDGLDGIKEKYGEDVKINIIENIQEGPDADRIMNKMVGDGNKVLILGSFGYMNGGLKLAKRNPDLTFRPRLGVQGCRQLFALHREVLSKVPI